MPKASTMTADLATKPHGILGSENAASVQLSAALADKAKQLFDKPYRALVDILSTRDVVYPERDAHYRLAHKRKFTALEISRLLQSEEGIHFLVVLMDGRRPRWWKAILNMGILGSVEARRRADAKLLSRVFHADDTAASEFSTAFRAQDPDFYGAVLAGHDEAAGLGISSRPLAPSKGRRR